MPCYNCGVIRRRIIPKNKVLLVILDGWGLSATEYGNAPLLANTPVLDFIYLKYPKTSLSASGLEVGLSPGENGNSEVGHLNLGSGRVVWESLPLIDQAISSGEMAQNSVLLGAIENCKKKNSVLHLIGLTSDGGVHAHINHLLAIMKIAAEKGLENILIHFISDGRDTAPKQASVYADQIEAASKKLGAGRIATLVGRYLAMDRDKNMDRIQRAFDLMVKNSGQRYGSAKEAIEANYKNGKSDEFIEPSVIGDGGVIKDGDSVIFYNYRSDRARQLSDMFYKTEFMSATPKDLYVCTMARYRKEQTIPPFFEPVNLDRALGQLISGANLSQSHIAETEKFAHVTYFFNAGIEKPYPKENDILIPSKKVATYDLAPEMSAPEITKEVLKSLDRQDDFIVVNYANGDMVGHSGILKPTIKACETVDKCLFDVFRKASEMGYKAILTADHGNCESMIDEVTEEPNKEHTTNPVPFVFFDFQSYPFDYQTVNFSRDDYFQYASGTPIGVLADISPSILANLGIPQPPDMSGMDLTIAMS